MKIGHFTKNCH
jgi:hypothetical protein